MTINEYNEIVKTYSDSLYRFALKNIKVVEDAQEIVQNAFEKLWINRNNVDAEKCKAFLFKVAYNYTIDIIRKQKKEVDMEVVTYTEPQADNSDFKDLKRILERALESISEPQRNSIVLRDYEGYSYQEIGEIMQMSEAQVKINIFRGRKNLQQILGNMEDYL
jgi:RNA polymerase sigma-70 factor (ECF subfamily)